MTDLIAKLEAALLHAERIGDQGMAGLLMETLQTLESQAKRITELTTAELTIPSEQPVEGKACP